MPAKIVMYSTRFCPFCIQARRLLTAKNADFSDIDVGGDQTLWGEMSRLSNGGDTVPQIFINDQPIGGYSDMVELDHDGKLDDMLATSP